MGKKVVISGGVNVDTRKFISSNRGDFTSGVLKRAGTTKLDEGELPKWEVLFVDLKTFEQYRYRFVDYMRIGRTPPEKAGEVKFVLANDLMASSNHAIIYVKDSEFIIEDTGSTNHTFVNGERIDQPTVLEQGSVVKFGDTRLQVALGRS